MTTRTSTKSKRSGPVSTTHGNGGHHRTRSRLRISMVTGVLVAVSVAAVGALYATSQEAEWTAETHLLVGPGQAADEENLSAYYETLSRGQVTATAAAIVDQPQFLQAARKALDLKNADNSTARASVVPGTSLVSVAVTATSPRTAEALANELAERSVSAVNRLLRPYGVEPLESARGSATASGLSTGQLTALVAVAALVAGFGTQQLVQYTFGGSRTATAAGPPREL